MGFPERSGVSVPPIAAGEAGGVEEPEPLGTVDGDAATESIGAVAVARLLVYFALTIRATAAK